jgi:hypothetical protein
MEADEESTLERLKAVHRELFDPKSPSTTAHAGKVRVG